MRICQWGIRHWCVTGFAVLAMLGIGSLFLGRVHMQEDIEVMLPDSDPAFVAGYRLLKQAPLSHRILIDLEADQDDQVSVLTQTAERLSEQLKGPLISRVIAGLSMDMGASLLDWLYAHMPQLFTEADEKALAAATRDDLVARTLQDDLNALSAPEGLWLRAWLSKDPLGLRNQVFRKLGAVAFVPEARLEGGFVMDPTGRHVLVIAETPVSMGDSAGGQQLLDQIEKAIAAAVPSGIRAHVVCGHRYTVANARTIKDDLVRVFVVSSVGLAVVFVLMIRSWRAIFVFAVPSLATFAAVLLTAAVFGEISAITVGFGAVLLGIADDYGLHVFFFLRGQKSQASDRMADLIVSMAVSWVTTVGVFVVLLGSSVPIQRQLAVFSIAGLAVALVLGVVWLPRWVLGGTQGQVGPLFTVGRHRGRWIIAAWLVALVACVPLGLRVRFDGDLRNLGMMPKDVLADEYCIRDVWGDPRGRALVVVQDANVESALQGYERLYACMADQCKGLVSLAPLLPSRATQLANLDRWRHFWRDEGRLERLRESLDTQGRALHFSKDAFSPFLEWAAQEREPFEVADLQEAMGPLMETLILPRAPGLGLITLMPDTDQALQVVGASGLTVGVESVSQRRFTSILQQSLGRDFRRFLWGTLAMVLLVLCVALRDVRKVILCLLPAVTGWLVMLAIMGLLGMKVNLFNMAAGVLVMGLSIDYGVFIVEHAHHPDGVTDRTVVTSALTTVGGFGALALAHHPAMFSLGLTVVLGLIPAMICTLLVIPALQGRRPIG